MKEKLIRVESVNGSYILNGFELPDDHPQGKYFLNIQSNLSDFGKVRPRRI